MREISLHILDLVENSIRAGAAVIEVSLEEEPARDCLTVRVEDDGPGLPVSGETAADPFFTTKEGKKTGLGLSLFKFRAEQAGGSFQISRSSLGGLAVRACMPLSSVDRSPLGDLAGTLASVVCTNPEIELRSRLRVDDREWTVSTAEVARALPAGDHRGISLAHRIRERVSEGLAALNVTG